MKTNLRSISEDGGGLLPSPETRVKLGWSRYSKEEEMMGGSGGAERHALVGEYSEIVSCHNSKAASL